VPVLVVPIAREAIGRNAWPEMDDAELFGWVGDPAAPSSWSLPARRGALVLGARRARGVPPRRPVGV